MFLFQVPELQGEPEDIAIEKAKLAFKQAGGFPVIIEDVSLCFDALNGLPGPYIKWFLEKVGHEGLNKMLQGFNNFNAYAMCIFSYMDSNLQNPKLFIGKTNGKIVMPRGPKNFGWDPIFEPEGFKQTYAEMKPEVKNQISHRFKAIMELLKYFKSIK